MAKDEVAAQLGSCRPKADKQRNHDGRRMRPQPMLRCSWGRIGHGMTNSEGTEGRGVGHSRGRRAATAV